MSDAFVSLLPNNSTQLERALEQVFADSLPDHSGLQTLWNPDTVPTEFLGALAWSLSVDDWDANWTDEVKREVIKASYSIHSQKGSVASIKAALSASGYPQASVIENTLQQAAWISAGGRYLDGATELNGESFSVATPPNSMTTHWAEYLVEFNLAQAPALSSDQAALRRRIEATAPARCKLAALLYRFSQDFYARVLVERPFNTIEIAFKDCRAFSVHKPLRIDGCKALSGDSAPIEINGTNTLDGRENLTGLMPTGESLNQGWGFASLTVNQELNTQSKHLKKDEWALGDAFDSETLNGARTLGEPALDGKIFLNGAINLSITHLSRPFHALLNGARTLGSSSESFGTSFFINAILCKNNTQQEIAI